MTAALLVSMVTQTVDHVTAMRREQRRKCVTPSQDNVSARWDNTVSDSLL